MVGRAGAARPDPAQAAWLYAQMVRWGQAPLSDELLAAAKAVFRPDLYDAALPGEADAAEANRPTASALLRDRRSTTTTSPRISPPRHSAVRKLQALLAQFCALHNVSA